MKIRINDKPIKTENIQAICEIKNDVSYSRLKSIKLI